MNQCSFLVDGINPFHREGVYLDKVGAELLKDGKQPGTASIIEQVAQVTLLRVILPWMIGQAFERLSDPAFIQLLGQEVNLPVPSRFQLFIGGKPRISLGEMLTMAANSAVDEVKGKNALGAGLGSPTPLVIKEATGLEYKRKVGSGVQNALAEQFRKYKLTGKTWAKLTRAQESTFVPPETAALATALAGTTESNGPFVAAANIIQGTTVQDPAAAPADDYINRDGSGVLKRGAQRYQVLVPSYTVMFAFFLVLNVGWVFVSERRQGTLKRLRRSGDARSNPVGQADTLLRALGGSGRLPPGSGPPALRDALGAGRLALVETNGVACAGGVVHVVGRDGLGFVGGVHRADGDSGGALRSGAGIGTGVDRRLRPAARDDAGERPSIKPVHTARLVVERLSRTARHRLQDTAEPDNCGASVRRADGVRPKFPGPGVGVLAVGLGAGLLTPRAAIHT